MKRLVAIILLAGLAPAPPARAADHPVAPVVPTAPSVPPPVLENGGMVVPAAGVARIVPPIRERIATRPISTQAPLPLPTGYTPPHAPAAGCPAEGCASADCGKTRWGGACLERFKAWLCFQPTTRDALPKLRPHPYVGPITGVYPCTSTSGCATPGCAPGTSCPTGNGCATTEAGRVGIATRLGGLFHSRGGRGPCIPPPDDAFPGYHFARNPALPVGGSIPLPPAVPVAPPAGSIYVPPAPVQPLEPQSRATPQLPVPVSVKPAVARSVQPSGATSPRTIRWASWPAGASK